MYVFGSLGNLLPSHENDKSLVQNHTNAIEMRSILRCGIYDPNLVPNFGFSLISVTYQSLNEHYIMAKKPPPLQLAKSEVFYFPFSSLFIFLIQRRLPTLIPLILLIVRETKLGEMKNKGKLSAFQLLFFYF